MRRLPALLALTGALFLAATSVLAITQAPLGSALFFGCAAAMAVAYAGILARIWSEPRAPRRLVHAALLLSLAFRVPLVAPRVNSDNDMVRYLWDGRVQTLGYSPYQVVPSDPALSATHTDETRRMPSLHARTPYPPGAQLFFRLVVSIHDSTRTMKLALFACDLATILVLWRWLLLTGQNEWLFLTYAWNPLVVLEIAHSGHLDALGALWIVASAYWLARRRTALASIAFVLAVATKLLPIVLLPIFWRRVRARDAAAGATLLAILYLAYTRQGVLPFGAVPNVVKHIRFNGPLFRYLAGLATPQIAALSAVGAGLLVAMWARWRLGADEAGSWAWPMAVALAGAPVIYPWYLLYFTPFLFSVGTLPLTAWTVTAISTYIVWELAFFQGARWVVPPAVMMLEFAIPLIVGAVVLWRTHLRRTAHPQTAQRGRTRQNLIGPLFRFRRHDRPQHEVGEDAWKGGRQYGSHYIEDADSGRAPAERLRESATDTGNQTIIPRP